MEYAQAGIMILQSHMALYQSLQYDQPPYSTKSQKSTQRNYPDEKEVSLYIDTLARGFFNLGAELEHLHHYDD